MQWPIRSRKSEKDRLYNGQSETVNQRRRDYTMVNQNPQIREGQTIQWPIRNRKSEKNRLYNGQSEAVNQRRTDYTMVNPQP